MMSVTSYPDAVEVLRDCFVDNLLGTLIAELSMDQLALRSALVASQLLGLAMLHDLIPTPGLENIPTARLADAIAPELQRLLVGELGI